MMKDMRKAVSIAPTPPTLTTDLPMKLSLKPKQIRTTAKAAWWYDDKRSIHILVQGFAEGLNSCHIKRSELLKYINRSAP